MKCKIIVFLLLLSTLYGCFQTTEGTKQPVSRPTFQKEVFELHTVEDLYSFLTYDEQSVPLISAHRGGATLHYPENALETFAHTSSVLPAIIECDVRLSKDSVMVLMHDETLHRTTNGKGMVSDFTIAELKQLRLKDTAGNMTRFQIPTLEEALVWGKGKVIFTLDIKKGVSYQKISTLIENLQAKAFVIPITYNTNQALAMHRINPDLMLSVAVKNQHDLKKIYQAGIPDNKIVAFVGTKQPDKDLVKALHDHGIKIILGTIGNLDRQAESKGHQVYAEYIEAGADILSTDRPFAAYEALDYYIRKRKLSSKYIND